MALQVLVCAELPVVRDGLCASLEGDPDIEVVESTRSGCRVLTLAQTTTVDVVVMGLGLTSMPAIELITRLSGAWPTPRIVVYAVDEDDDTIADVLHAGATVLLTDCANQEDLLSAIRAAARGDALLAPRIAGRLIGWFRQRDAQPDQALRAAAATLTPREREVLHLTAQGQSAEDIARDLFIGVATVRTHIHRLRGKLNATDRAQLVSFAFRAGLMMQPSRA